MRCTAHGKYPSRLGLNPALIGREWAMSCTARLFLCARCRCQVVLCSHGDRGNRYCSASRAQAARRHAQRAAARRYRASRRGRLAQAARQQRYRRRQCKKVTHQGSPVLSVH